MNSELKILVALWDLGGEAPLQSVANAAGLSFDYARIISRNLGRDDYVDWFGSHLTLRPKGKLEAAKFKMSQSSKEKELIQKETEAEKEASRISKKLLPHHRIDEAIDVDEDYQPMAYPVKSGRKKKHIVLNY